MDNISSPGADEAPVSISLKSSSIASTAFRPPQGHSAIPGADHYQNYNTMMVASIRSRQNSHLSDDTCEAAPENVSSGVTAYSSFQEKHNTEQHEPATSAGQSDVTDEAIQPRSHSRFRNLRKIVVKFWLWEVAACVFSLLSLASIVGILIYEDGRLLDQWKWSIPPTAVVSFIGTLGKASLGLVLSQILSQMKWLHFKETRSLKHVRTFDGASRGPLGAALVIWDSKQPLVSFAACLMILTILVDPSVQLVFTFPSRLVEDDFHQQAIFQRAVEWNDDSGYDFLPPQSMVVGINRGLTTTNIVPSIVCPSGNCIWSEPIKTLGVCGSCSDVTADVKVSCSPTLNITTGLNITSILMCNYTYDGLYTLQASQYNQTFTDQAQGSSYSSSFFSTVWNSTYANSSESEGAIYNTNITFTNMTVFTFEGHSISPQPQFLTLIEGESLEPHVMLGGSLVSFGAVQLLDVGELESEEDPLKIPTAKCWNCDTYWCEKSLEAVRITDNAPPSYTVSTKRLVFLEVAPQFNPNQPYSQFDENITSGYYGIYPDELQNQNETIINFRYRMSRRSDAVFRAFSALFDSYYAYGNDGGNYAWTQFGAGNFSSQVDLSENTEAILGLVLSKDLNVAIQAITDSLTEVIRTGPNSTSVIGQNLTAKSFIQVRWAWLALPFVLWVMTCVLLLFIAVKSHSDKIAVWKDDPLALLFHSVNGAEALPGSDSHTGSSDLDNLADEVHVKLDRDRPFMFVVSAKKA